MRLLCPRRAAPSGKVVVMEEEEALHPLRNSDQGEAVGAKSCPDGDSEEQMSGPCSLPALRQSQHIGGGAEADGASMRPPQHQLRRIEISGR